VTGYGDGETRIFSVSPNVSARITKLAIVYSGINNDGTLFLTDVSLTQLFFNPQYGVILSTGNLTLNNSVVADGRVGTGGGGIAALSGRLIINNSYIRNNGTYNRNFMGGGIYLNGTGRINKSTIAANWTSDYNNFDAGGGIYAAGGTLSIINSTLDGNSTYYGKAGAIYAAPPSSVSVLNSTITHNTYSGGYINCAVYSNSNVSLKNTLIFNPADIYGAIISGGNNFVSNASGASGFAASDILNITPTISALGYYGGPTPTVKPYVARGVHFGARLLRRSDADRQAVRSARRAVADQYRQQRFRAADRSARQFPLCGGQYRRHRRLRNALSFYTQKRTFRWIFGFIGFGDQRQKIAFFLSASPAQTNK
jgi:hypothetical protein